MCHWLAGAMGMYPLNVYAPIATSGNCWYYCAGTGGSALSSLFRRRGTSWYPEDRLYLVSQAHQLAGLLGYLGAATYYLVNGVGVI